MPLPDGQERERRWHYVKRNETTKVPRRLVFLDTEAHQSPITGGHAQGWAIAVACFRSQRPDRKAAETWSVYDDPELLWKDVDAYCGASGRTVLWTHNLGYDARISEMFTILPEQGWTLVAHNLIGKGTWLMWRRGRASLTMVDSQSVFPCELLQVGKVLRLPKLKLPDGEARGVGLYSRCWRDVEILRLAVISYLDWLETEDLGNWQLTGAGQSWATFRHKFMDRRLLVHDDQDALAAERRAMWTGRCEAYWHGELGFQVVHEWDLSLAYARVAQETNVPVRLLGPMPEDYEWLRILGSKSTALLAECTITTDVPVVPAAHDGRILWPVGTFRTTLWDVEVKAALDAGAHVEVHRGWLYHKAPALKSWADWIIEQLDRCGGPDTHWLYIVLKHWARALIGRFAMTYTKWEEYATAPTPMVRAHNVYDDTTGETFRTVQIGQTMWRDAGTREWGESMPMVTGYIQAVCRMRLWTIIREAPPRAALYADTDSILVTDMHSAAIAAIAQRHPHWGLRLKRSWQGFAVWGPRQIRTGPAVRVSGVSKRAVRTDKRTFAGEVWETLEGAMTRGHANQVIVKDRIWHIRGVDYRRDGPEIGWTQPRRLPYAGHRSPNVPEEYAHADTRDGGRAPSGAHGASPGQGRSGTAQGAGSPRKAPGRSVAGRTGGRQDRQAPGRGGTRGTGTGPDVAPF